MKRIQKLLLKLRDPSPAVLILLIICSTVLLIYTFTREAPNPGIQYFSYLFSAHTLVVLCIAAHRKKNLRGPAARQHFPALQNRRGIPYAARTLYGAWHQPCICRL